MVENILFQIKFLVFVFLLLCSAIFKELKDTGVKYRNRIRSRISNLKDLKNPNLRINVLLGIITPERLAVLTAEVCFMRVFVYSKTFSCI